MRNFTPRTYMKRYAFACVAVIIGLLSFPQFIYSQTLISPTGDGGFENGTTFAANGWTIVNNTSTNINNWVVGTATIGGGSRSAYISTNGSNYNYNINSTSTVHLYRSVSVPAGATAINLSFLLKSSGESSNWDQLLVFYGSGTLTTGAPSGQTTTLTGYTNAFTQTSITTYASSYQTVNVTLPNTVAGTTFNLVFTWKNDNSTGAQPPASVDNISLTYTPPPPCANPSAPTGVTFGTSTVNSQAGTITAPATAPTGYFVVASTSSTLSATPVNGTTTYAVGQAFGGGTIVYYNTSTAFTTPTTLTSNTNYYYFVYSYNSGCTGGAPFFSTAYALSPSPPGKYTCIAAPTGLNSPSSTQTTADLAWTAPNGAVTSYTIKYGTTSGSYSNTATSGTNSVTLNSLTAGQTYYYVVVSNNTANNSSCGTASVNSTESSFQTVCATPLAPTGVTFGTSTVNSQAGTIGVPATVPTGYIVITATSSTFTGSFTNGSALPTVGSTNGNGTVRSVGTSTAFTASSLASNVNYYYFVYSYNSGCKNGPYYSTTYAGNPTAPSKYTCIAAPTGLTATMNSTTAENISWTDPNGNITSYTINYGVVSGAYTNSATSSTTSVTLTGLLFGTKYYYQVVANNTSNNSSCGQTAASVEGNFIVQCGTFAATISIGGTTTIAGSQYPTLTAAINTMINCSIMQPTVLEINTSYNAASETYPIVLPTIAGQTAVNTITIYPASNASPTITSANTTATIEINNGKNWIIDGRQGGTGTSTLNIINTSTATGGSAIRLINGSQNNVIRYSALKASYASIVSGVVVFSTAPSGGNSNNTITQCNIDGNALTSNGIFSSGSSAGSNNTNTISDNNILNVFSASLGGSAIDLENYSSAWTITGNKIYQTASRTVTSNTGYTGIEINASSGTGFTVNDNTIGYANSSGTGVTTFTGSLNYSFTGIYMNVSSSSVSNIQGNLITALSITSAAADPTYSFAGILTTEGRFNIGTTDANIIGAATGTGAITITSSSNGSYVVGIDVDASSSNSISNNIIGSISTGSNTRGYNFLGIAVDDGSSIGNFTISNNQIGSSSADAIRIGTNVSTPTTQTVEAIGVYALNTGTTTVSANTINNISAYSSSTSSYLEGVTIGGVFIIIPFGPTTTISQNIISNLTVNTTNYLSGIDLVYGSNTGTVSRNNINNLAGTGNGVDIYGIEIILGSWNISNNMVSVTNKTNSNGATLHGIIDYATFNTVNSYFNSIYIGGSSSSSSYNSYAYERVIANASVVENNIFVNNRTGGTATQYAVYNSTNSGYTSDYNIYNAKTTTIGNYGGSNQTFAQWQANASSTGKDAHSYTGITNTSGNYVTFTDADNGNLHLTSANNCISNGTGLAISGYTIDYDAETRSNPPDIGADEFTSTFSTVASITSTITSTCYGTPVTLTATPAGGVWSSTNTAIATIDATGKITPVAVAGGTTIISYTYTVGSCVTVATINPFTVNPLPIASFSGTTTSTCYGSTTSITINGTANASVAYSINSTPQTPVTLNGSGTTTITTIPITGTTTYSLTSVTNTTTNCTTSLNATYTVTVTTGSFAWTGNASTEWNAAGNWCSGNIPTTTSVVTIPVVSNNRYPVISTANATAASVTIASGASLTMSGIYNLAISTGGTFTNNGGTFNATGSTTGAVTFNGGTVNGSSATTFKNITSGGALTLTTAPTITGIFQINGGAVTTTSPTYTNTSTLIYGVTGAYSTGLEWYNGASGTTTAGIGIPQNVTIQSGTVTFASSGGTTDRALAGNITISTGAILSANTRDIYILGNWINNGTFNASTKKVQFNSAAIAQTISGTTTFYDLNLANSVDFTNTTTTISNSLSNSSGTMTPGTSTIVFTGYNTSSPLMTGSNAKNFYNLQINSGAYIIHNTGLPNSNIHVANSFLNNGTLNEGTGFTLYFDKPSGTETFNGTGTSNLGKLVIGDPSGLSSNITLNGNANFTVAGGNVTFYHSSVYNASNNTATFSTSPATITGTGTANFYNAVTSVALNVGASPTNTRINNMLTLDPGGSVQTNSPTYVGTATLVYNTNTNFAVGPEWNANTSLVGLGQPYHVTIQNISSGATLPGDRTVPGALNLVNVVNVLALNNNTLTVNTAITGSGSLTGSQTSGLILGGTAAALRFTSGGFNNYLKTLIINSGGSAALASNLNIAAGTFASSGVLTADGALSTGNFLTMKSDANGDARIGASQAAITGNVTVERYIPARRAWRFLGAPFSTSSQTISQAWQENAVNPDLTCANNANPSPGYGTQITYNGTNGYDPNTTVNPSIKTWNHTLKAWETPSSTTGPKITDYKAYCLFVRGDRTICLSQGVAAGFNNTTLRATGILNETGTDMSVPYSSYGVNENIFIGNPFASPINLNSVFKNNENSTALSGLVRYKFAIWDPGIANGYGVGGYVIASDGILAPHTSKYQDTADAGKIQSGQAFFLYISNSNASGNGSFTFKQSNKTGTEFNAFNLTATTLNPEFMSEARRTGRQPRVYINLLLPGDSAVLLDGAAAMFDSVYLPGIDDYDASKKFNFNENIGLKRDGKSLAIEARPLPTAWDTLYVRNWLLTAKDYVIQTVPQFVPSQVKEAWLIDNYLKSEYQLSLTDTTNYTFTANADTNSYAGRFLIVFRVERKQQTVIAGGNTNVPEALTTAGKVTVSPNPVTGRQDAILHFVNMTKGMYEVEMYNTAGRKMLVRTISHSGGSSTYSLKINPAWAADKYNIVVVNKKTGEVKTLPLIVAR